MTLKDRIAQAREQMAQAALKAGRNPRDILLCAACKAQNSETVRQAAEYDIDLFGENRMQEMAVHLADKAYQSKPMHFIGHLQTNKVRQVVGQAALIQSVGSLRLLNAIDKAAAQKEITQDVLIEVNIGQEAGKAGVTVGELPFLLEKASELPNIRLRGLMAIPPPGPEKETRQYFARMFALQEQVKGKAGANSRIDTLSLGMSDSFVWAILEGATLVRVGRQIFGERV